MVISPLRLGGIILKRTRGEFLFRTIILFTMAIIVPIILIVTSIINPEQFKIGQAIGFSVFAAVLFVIVGLINLSFYNRDKNAEEEKDKRIQQLEEQLKREKEIKNDQTDD